MKMTRILFGCFAALCLTFVIGCSGGGTETTVIESEEITMEEQAALDAEYEAQMAEGDEEPDE